MEKTENVESHRHSFSGVVLESHSSRGTDSKSRHYQSYLWFYVTTRSRFGNGTYSTRICSRVVYVQEEYGRSRLVDHGLVALRLRAVVRHRVRSENFCTGELEHRFQKLAELWTLTGYTLCFAKPSPLHVETASSI
jgi:hypothetical protein